MNRRRFLQALFAVPCLGAPLLVPVLVKPRCDADWIEGEWAAGREVRGGTFVVRRPLQMRRPGLVLADCDIKFHCAPGIEVYNPSPAAPIRITGCRLDLVPALPGDGG